jgi:hypothetical protein
MSVISAIIVAIDARCHQQGKNLLKRINPEKFSLYSCFEKAMGNVGGWMEQKSYYVQPVLGLYLSHALTHGN